MERSLTVMIIDDDDREIFYDVLQDIDSMINYVSVADAKEALLILKPNKIAPLRQAITDIIEGRWNTANISAF